MLNNDIYEKALADLDATCCKEGSVQKCCTDETLSGFWDRIMDKK